MQLKVVKTDGSVEEYYHTKVIGAINTALTSTGRPDIRTAEDLAQAVTYYLYKTQKPHTVLSSEILSVIKAVLTSTGYEDAAAALSEHHIQRRLKRSRIEVVKPGPQHVPAAGTFARLDEFENKSPWDKSRIVAHLLTKHNIERQTARTIAAMVEEKVFKIGLNRVPADLVEQLVLSDAAAMLQAQDDLQMV